MSISRAAFLGGVGSTALLPSVRSFAIAEVHGKTTIVLVHGALMHGDSWLHVVPLLRGAGHRVVAIDNALNSLASDVANTRRVLRGIRGPVILVGHSYGGCVITGAALDDRNVKGLVYIAALAPDQGQSANDVVSAFPKMPSSDDFRRLPTGRLIVAPERFAADLAADVDPREARGLAASQKSIAAKAFSEKSGAPAWRRIPSWYAVSTDDRALNPRLQAATARKIRATTVSLRSSHLSYVSHPHEIAALILRAAGNV